MKTKVYVVFIVGCALSMGAFATAFAQQPQIPTLQVCNATGVGGRGTVHIESRQGGGKSGNFSFQMGMDCGLGGYPSGNLQFRIDMTDSTLVGFRSTDIEQLTSTGKHSPTAYLNGRCEANPAMNGCRFWAVVADNNGTGGRTPDVVGFLVVDGTGKRIAYGTGALVEGDVKVAPTSN